jgi:hypothetical protein
MVLEAKKKYEQQQAAANLARLRQITAEREAKKDTSFSESVQRCGRRGGTEDANGTRRHAAHDHPQRDPKEV